MHELLLAPLLSRRKLGRRQYGSILFCCRFLPEGLRKVQAKGVFAGPSGPLREGPGVRHKTVSDMKHNSRGKEERKKEVKLETREREIYTEKYGKRQKCS